MSARWKFWLITLSTVLAVATTLALGRWQLSRAAQKAAVQHSIDSRAALPPLNGPALLALADPASALHRGVLLRGNWIAQRTVFLDNRQMNDKAGLFVLTPLQIEGTNQVVLVQRGWVARNFLDRSALPALATAGGLVEVHGRLAPPPSKLYQLGVEGSGPIRQNLDLNSFSAEASLALLPVTVQQTGATGEALLRDWPRIGAGVDTHYGYAFQWFGLSALIATLYVWFQIVKRRIRPG